MPTVELQPKPASGRKPGWPDLSLVTRLYVYVNIGVIICEVFGRWLRGATRGLQLALPWILIGSVFH
jgi:hypothetical protein